MKLWRPDAERPTLTPAQVRARVAVGLPIGIRHRPGDDRAFEPYALTLTEEAIANGAPFNSAPPPPRISEVERKVIRQLGVTDAEYLAAQPPARYR